MALPAWNLLKGKTAAITGGTTGIGRAIVLGYISQGCNVAVNHLGLAQDESLRHSLLEEVKVIEENVTDAGKILEIPGDVTSPETSTNLVKEAASQWGKLDIFVANAGVFKQAEILKITPSLLNHSIDVNVKGCFYSCQAAARQMVKQGYGGSIIGVSSVSALLGGGLQTHYTPTKAAILSMMQSMAIALGKDQIRCNALMPGTIATQLADHDMKNPDKKAALEERIPLGRIGSPDDMVGPAVFLACEEMSRYVNGTGLLADGGMYSKLQ
ncbi:SDR family NAD(P)-dependent oxidoreductase [Aspergillus ruber CBS 135680]|uniref:3-oxoacyl-reductase n=1 Tax=Aspergillus ruber (strain CBS 135680) TaxID=1388766 RepID=A0A017SSB8_ASPRC|nr:3-oxoacyl-reductase [Aspergillus ruber CBS 135680]EYE99160.1 3-oxoacyl-reductase [Aspergillus ruber CBS 135680]